MIEVLVRYCGEFSRFAGVWGLGWDRGELRNYFSIAGAGAQPRRRFTTGYKVQQLHCCDETVANKHNEHNQTKPQKGDVHFRDRFCTYPDLTAF